MMEFRLKGILPEESMPAFREAMADTHIVGLINHCAEVLVWKRMCLSGLAGVVIGYVLAAWLPR
jgi:hypothetical protein